MNKLAFVKLAYIVAAAKHVRRSRMTKSALDWGGIAAPLIGAGLGGGLGWWLNDDEDKKSKILTALAGAGLGGLAGYGIHSSFGKPTAPATTTEQQQQDPPKEETPVHTENQPAPIAQTAPVATSATPTPKKNSIVQEQKAMTQRFLKSVDKDPTKQIRKVTDPVAKTGLGISKWMNDTTRWFLGRDKPAQKPVPVQKPVVKSAPKPKVAPKPVSKSAPVAEKIIQSPLISVPKGSSSAFSNIKPLSKSVVAMNHDYVQNMAAQQEAAAKLVSDNPYYADYYGRGMPTIRPNNIPLGLDIGTMPSISPSALQQDYMDNQLNNSNILGRSFRGINL